MVAGPNRSVLAGWTVPVFNDAFWDLHVLVYTATREKLAPDFRVPYIIGEPGAGVSWNQVTQTFVVVWCEAETVGDGYIERMLLQNLDRDGQPATPQPHVISET